MSQQIITTKRGIYGRFNITLPLSMKTTMLAWAKTSGMKKAEFLRLAITTGFLVLSKGISNEIVKDDGGADCRKSDSLSSDGGSAATPYTDRGVEIRKIEN